MPKIDYYYDIGTPPRKPKQNWFSIDEKKIKFKDRLVSVARLLKDKYIIVSATSPDHKNRKDNRNIFCYNLKGKLLWQIEPPRTADGRPINYIYFNLLRLPDWEEVSISKRGHLLVYVDGVWPEVYKDSGYGKIWYEIDFEAGKIVGIYENARQKNDVDHLSQLTDPLGVVMEFRVWNPDNPRHRK